MLGPLYYCLKEDARGRTCQYGPGHVGNCRFTPLRVGSVQRALLEAARDAVGNVWTVRGHDRAVRVMRDHAFITARRSGPAEGRLWTYALTAAGRRVVNGLPRSKETVHANPS
jgi:hypothetical protein